ncbi:MAG: DUF1574 family protein [Spirochaetota bacterium]
MKHTFWQKKSLILPLIFAGIVFAIEKVAGSKFVRKYTETRIEYSFYKQKEPLLEQLLTQQKQRKAEDKLLLLSGTSHFGEFSGQYIADKLPGVSTYNFSAPMASPSFLYYYLEKIIQQGIRVDYAILEAIPEIFQDKANRYAIKFSYDWNFMLRYSHAFSLRELEAFSSANLFASIRFPVRFKSILNRIKNPAATLQLEYMQKLVQLATQRNNGGIPNPIIHKVSKESLPEEAKHFFATTLAGYQESKTQRYFFNRYLQLCKKHNIKVLLLRPLVSQPLEQLIRKEKFYHNWKTKTLQQAQKYQYPLLELESKRKDIKCQEFVDVHHLSGGCYPEITDIVLAKLKEI